MLGWVFLLVGKGTSSITIGYEIDYNYIFRENEEYADCFSQADVRYSRFTMKQYYCFMSRSFEKYGQGEDEWSVKRKTRALP